MTEQGPQYIEPKDEVALASTALGERFGRDDSVEWIAWDSIPVVNTFGEPQAEYAAIRKGAALFHWPQRGVLELAGSDRHVFLNNLLTNALINPHSKQPFAAGHGCYAFFLNLKGRIVADVRVLELGADRTLIECQRSGASMLIKAFDQYLFAEKVTLRDRSDELHVLALHGAAALSLLADAADSPPQFAPPPADFPATVDLPTAGFTIGGVDVIAWREDVCAVPGVHLIVARENLVRLWDDLMTRFGQAHDEQQYALRRLRPAGWAMFNACRIEAGVPMLGIDFTAAPPSRPGRKAQQVPETKGGTLPAETGPLFAKAVSVSGGCYLGQEVVARMHARNVVARKIVGVRMDEDALPTAGAEIEVDDQPVGVVTSSTLSPVLSNACIALAMIKRPHFEVGTRLSMLAEGRRAQGAVVELPFIR